MRDVTELVCTRCGDGYTKHLRGGECRAVDDDGRCPCLGFRWLDAAAALEADRGYPSGGAPQGQSIEDPPSSASRVPSEMASAHSARSWATPKT
jgi:hypothetical protein